MKKLFLFDEEIIIGFGLIQYNNIELQVKLFDLCQGTTFELAILDLWRDTIEFRDDGVSIKYKLNISIGERIG